MHISSNVRIAIAGIVFASASAHAGGYGMPGPYKMPGPYGMPGQGHPGYGAPGYGAPAQDQRGYGMAPYGRQGYRPQGSQRSSQGAASGYGSRSAGAAPAHSASGADGGGATPTVSVSGMQFQPATLKVSSGDTVVWSFADAMPHTATARNGDFSSSRKASGGTFRHTFEEPGEYDYYCAVHPNMTGTIIVE